MGRERVINGINDVFVMCAVVKARKVMDVYFWRRVTVFQSQLLVLDLRLGCKRKREVGEIQ